MLCGVFLEMMRSQHALQQAGRMCMGGGFMWAAFSEMDKNGTQWACVSQGCKDKRSTEYSFGDPHVTKKWAVSR